MAKNKPSNEECDSISMERYDSDFSTTAQSTGSTSIREKALLQALEFRKFEINLYWERAKYFWIFIAVSFAAYGVTLSVNKPSTDMPFIQYIIICLGTTSSFAWYLVNRGSQFWQRNWEKHVEMLEDKVIGLFKTPIDIKLKEGSTPSRWEPFCYENQSYPQPVSCINLDISWL